MNYSSHLLLVLLLLCGVACVPITQQQQPSASGTSNGAYYVDKQVRTIDTTYEESVQTVLFYPAQPTTADPVSGSLQAPVISIAQSTPLVLEFDELGTTFRNFRAKVLHCNADWSMSLLNDIEFVEGFNDFLFSQPRLSINTKVPYVHYRFEVPKVKLSGNFVLMVYREGNIKDIILTRRFIVYDNRVEIRPNIRFSTGVMERNLNQQIDFVINYPNYPLNNPRATVKVALRQNYKWDNAIRNLVPMNIREDQTSMEYNYFNLENNFSGGNEYRFFDMRSLRFLGQNVRKIDVANDSTQVYLLIDKPRAKQAYSQVIDFNGRFVIDNYEMSNGATEADYANVHFTLQPDEKVNGQVHLYGLLTNWTISDQTRLAYNATENTYTGNLLLKQGYYNYKYVLVTPNGKVNENYFEGSHFETENHYEIIVYYRPVGSRADLIIGYEMIRHNRRN
jgi:hypothetical protein